MQRITLFLIIVLAVVLRFWQLGDVPISPDWDEAALGYNAYSILKTGKDEYGVRFPLTLRSFDDYKPPLYAYLAIPTVAALGLQTMAVRLPSAIFGVFAILGTYYLVLALFPRHVRLALFSTVLLAVSPWHIQFSRIAFEANIGLTLNIWGAVFFFWGINNIRWFIASACIFGLSLYAYHSERIFVPLLLLLLSILWKKELFFKPKKVLFGIIIGLVTVLPLIPVILDKTSVTRLKGTSTLSDQTGLLMRSVAKLEEDRVNGNTFGVLFDNRRIVYAKTLIDGYISHFSFKWLFLTGDNDRHHAPDMGLMYLWELPFLLYGAVVLSKNYSRVSKLLFGWILLAPLAAAPTSETPHAIRTLVVLPAIQIITALGVFGILGVLIKTKPLFYKAIVVAGSILILFNIYFYLHMYFIHMNYEYSRFWQYGYKEAVEYAESRKSKYSKIVVSTELEQPHMFFLFYTNYDPAKYLEEGGTSSGGFAEVRNSFDIYEFRPIRNWDRELHDGSILYIGHPKEMPGNVKTIKYLNGEDAVRISE